MPRHQASSCCSKQAGTPILCSKEGPPTMGHVASRGPTMLLPYTVHARCHGGEHQLQQFHAWGASGLQTGCAKTLTVKTGDRQLTSRKVQHCLESFSGQLSTSPHMIRDQVSSLSCVSKGGAPAKQRALCTAHHC